MVGVVASGEVRCVDLHREVDERRMLEVGLVHEGLRPCGVTGGRQSRRHMTVLQPGPSNL
jgi:hypothetical protein